MKNRSSFLIGVVVLLLAGLFSCSGLLEGLIESAGGGGADFDPTLYYTRDQIDQKVSAATEILVGDNNQYPLTSGNAYSATLTAPVPVRGAFISVSADNTTGQSATIDVKANNVDPILTLTLSPGDKVTVNALLRGFEDRTSIVVKDLGSTGLVTISPTLWVRLR